MQTIKPLKSYPKRILGIDFGLRRLGLAVSDERKIIAIPLMTFITEKRSDQTVNKLLEILSELQKKQGYEIEEIVVGLPLLMSGKAGFLADEVKHFIHLLSQSTTIPIQTWDERLTTVQADRSLREENLTRKQRSKLVDTVSAVIILQSYLDNKNFLSSNKSIDINK